MFDQINRRGAVSVYSCVRDVDSKAVDLPTRLKLNSRIKMDGLKLLGLLPEGSAPVVVFDPQYRGVLDKLKFGNEGKQRGRARCELPQMTEEVIVRFLRGIERVLTPTGHCFLWVDKFHLCSGLDGWLDGTSLSVVDLISWDKMRMGMGYRSRRTTEYLVVLQKPPRRAKGVWMIHNIPDTWREKVTRKGAHPHSKPLELQSRLISAVSNEGDLVVDPAAGGFSVMEAALAVNRNFCGCDVNG